ncbi:DNA ejection [Escherichia phage Skarpretter]|uniref:DNA transfer protein n=1 Tax=Escherichia phage Skarpretter TaxID=2488654 RepID=A0A3G8F2Y1_9CAUD|nr:DNA ejection [Escherichia phage Skarpretter]AZF88655.1 hypothetical protein [Escherichia phage Skarpretter]
MGSVISGVTNAVGGIVGSIGANKAMNQQEKAINQQKDAVREGYNTASTLLTPYTQGGTAALASAQDIANNPLDRNQLLQDYYGGAEYQTMSNQANRQALASAEATGTLGSSTMQNRLGSITAQLGQNYLADMYNQQQQQFNNQYGLANMGLQASNQLAGYATGQGQQLATLYGNQGQVKAAKAALPWQTGANSIMSVGNGVAGMFGGGQV